MKKLILLSIMLLSVLFVNAQRNQGNAEEMAQKRVDRLTKQLDLTTDQQGQMYELVLNQFQNRRGKGKGEYAKMTKEEKTAFRAERNAAKTQYNNRIAEILTDEQMTKYRGNGQQRSKKIGKGKTDRPVKTDRSNRPAKANKTNRGGNKAKTNKPKKSSEERIQKKVDKMTEELGLSARQQDQLIDLYSSRGSKVKGQSRKELSKEERQAMKENRKQSKADFDSALAEILTPEQLAQHEASKSERKGKQKAKKGKRGKKGKKAKKARSNKI